MKKESTKAKSKTKWQKLRSMSDEDIDLSDIPEIDPNAFAKVEVRIPKPKELVSIRIDPDILEWFRRQGGRYQTRINAVLRSYVESQTR